MRRKPLLIAGLILALALAAVAAGSYWPQIAAYSSTVSSQAPFITPQELKKRLDQGENYLVADVRRRTAYDQLHLEGAVSLPMELHETWGPKLHRAQTLVIYCACETEDSAVHAARKLQQSYPETRVLILQGGLTAWIEAGYPYVERPIPAKLKRLKGS